MTEKRKRGRPPGTTKAHLSRDRLAHFAVEWVMLQTGRGVGRGQSEPAEPDACILASYLLSGGKIRGDYVSAANRVWLVEAVRANADHFQAELAQASRQPELLAQLRRMDHLAIRDAYQRERRRVYGESRQESVREAFTWSRRSQGILDGKMPAADPKRDAPQPPGERIAPDPDWPTIHREGN